MNNMEDTTDSAVKKSLSFPARVWRLVANEARKDAKKARRRPNYSDAACKLIVKGAECK